MSDPIPIPKYQPPRPETGHDVEAEEGAWQRWFYGLTKEQKEAYDKDRIERAKAFWNR